MGKIYAPSTDYNPDYSADFRELEKYDKEYTAQVVAENTIKGDPYSGKILAIPHADGYAQYVVRSLKPVVLIHLPVGDAWEAPYVNRMTASDIKGEIDRRERLAALFAR